MSLTPHQKLAERHLSALALRLFTECPLRFKRRYIDGLQLAGLPDDPDEQRALRQGERFHLMARRYYAGLQPGTLGDAGERAELEGWLDRLRRYLPRDPEKVYYPELELRLKEPFEQPSGPDQPALRLMAKFDLLTVESDGTATIYDWKTLRRMPAHQRLAEAFQTVVYRYVLCAAGGAYAPGGRFDPGRVTMVYWNPLRGGTEERFPYGAEQFAADGERLRRVVSEILSTPPDGFLPTGDERICARCEYRPLCHGQAAHWADGEGADVDVPVEEELPEEVAGGGDDPADLPLP
ncbi:PD-(D/E)XK nuclease family protein [Symbiobacterium terraclitae]|uniref:PD-(D/E)XK nuclease family protein n=1 Tax=Symbiobacterium terraclitae TaxID=557451 RepID=UPI0035B56BA8